MTNKITVRKGEKPLLVMDGTGDESKLWLCDPNQKAFFSYSVQNDPALTQFYQRQDQSWMSFSIQPVLNWQPVTHQKTVELLNEMERALFDWMKEGGHAAPGMSKVRQPYG